MFRPFAALRPIATSFFFATLAFAQPVSAVEWRLEGASVDLPATEVS